MEKLKLLSLFAGIGGFELGLERSGAFETVAQCEIDPFCNKVLAKHWPNVMRYGDVRELTAARLAADGIAVDAICGGFPCQDLSRANGVWSSRPGLEGSRSGLWCEYTRLIGEIRPSIIFVENVVDLVPWLGTILGDLASLGYDAEWDCLQTTVVGGRSPRERLWLVSYPCIERHERQHWEGKPTWNSGGIFDAVCRSSSSAVKGQDWLSEPPIPRVVDGVPNRLDRRDRTKAIGNAVVPQIPELIGRAIATSMHRTVK
jgi:DNA (cytosine-5)-methyltransferase 1